MTSSAAAEDRRSGEASDAARLYAAHVDAVFAYVARRIGRELAADVTAEAFRVAIEHLGRYDAARGSERAWLYGIATNLLRRHWRTEERRLRAMGRHVAAEVPGGDPLLQVAERLDATVEVARVMAAVADLTIEDRDLLVLVAWERCSYDEVARALGIPTGTVRSRLHRIRRTLHDAAHPDVPKERSVHDA
jgi:RNA polymerase sigma factor (sigma-70 family)